MGAVLLLAACGGVAPESVAEPEAEQPVARQQEAVEKPAEEEVVAEAETETESISPPAKPTPRQGFAATPPEEVQLASGQVQLVEFYATW